MTDAEGGEVLAATALHHSHEAAFRDALPLRVGLVRLDAGPTVVCFLADEGDRRHARPDHGARLMAAAARC